MTCKKASCHSCHCPTFEEELCLEIARQYDEEDLTHPPHRVHHHVNEVLRKEMPASRQMQEGGEMPEGQGEASG